MNHHRDRRGRDELIDALLDQALLPEQTRRAYESLRRDEAACEELVRLRYTVARLQKPIEAPDLSASILHRVNARRGFLPRRARRLVSAGRVAVAVGVVVAVGLASFLQRTVPQLRLTEGPMPMTQMVETTERTARARAPLAESTVDTIRASLASPIARLSLGSDYTPARDLRFDLMIPELPAPSAQRGATMRPVSAAPVALVDNPGPAEPFAHDRPNPFIGRFDSLLVVLRDPRPLIDDEESAADDR